MDGKVVMLSIGVAICLFIGIWTVSLVSNSVTLPTTHYVADNITFAANSTVYGFAQTVFTYDGLWNSTGHTCKYPAHLYTVTTTGISTALSNQSSGVQCPNGIGGATYSDYYYQQAGANTSWNSISGSVWNSFSLMGVVLIVIAAAAILAYFGFGKFSE